MPIIYKKLESNTASVQQFLETLSVFAIEFEKEDFNPPSVEHLSKLLANPDFAVFVAMENQKIVGGLTCHLLTDYYHEKKVAYLYDLAVAKQYQRQGIATNLLKTLKEFCLSQNIDEFFVQADNEDDHAIAFYQKTGGEAMPVTHFTYKSNTN